MTISEGSHAVSGTVLRVVGILCRYWKQSLAIFGVVSFSSSQIDCSRHVFFVGVARRKVSVRTIALITDTRLCNRCGGFDAILNTLQAFHRLLFEI